MKSYYLDYAAATPLDERVFVAMQPYLSDQYYNPSAAYGAARTVRADIESARHELAIVIGGKPSEIIITAGASESINLAIHGVLRHYGGSMVTIPIEHPAVLAAAKHYSCAMGVVDSRGLVDLESLRASIDDETTLISIGYANNELGTVQSLRDISEIVSFVRNDRRERAVTRPLYLHTDASQAAGHLDLSVSRLGIDMMTLNAGKCYGPKQVGLLWARPEIIMTPFVDGGGQERGLRSGTENVAGIVGFAKALQLVNNDRKEESYRLKNLRDSLQRQIVEAIPEIVINGHAKRRLPNHLHFSLPGLDGERALFALDQQGVMIATGSACAANKGTRSHVLTAVGMDPVLADSSLRITLGKTTTEDTIQDVAAIIIDILKTERGR
ncbi:cysteine desulfurase [Pedobacter sp.]|nr:cysteine desulfurase [Candidatus Saccharibacteria bacterium]